MGALRSRLQEAARRVTSPKLPRLPNGASSMLSGTGAPIRYVAPPQPAQPFDPDITLQRWIQQVRRERGHMHVMLHRMASEIPEMTAVYQRMRDLGYRIRGQAMTAINHEFGMAQAGDPHQPNVYFSNRRLIYKVCELHGLAVADMSPTERIAAVGLGDGRSAVYAYLQTFETEQPPVLVIDKDPYGIGRPHCETDARSIRVWTWYAANCLAKFLYDEEIYCGRGAVVETIAPFDGRRHAAFFPLSHSFAKGLLYLDNMCPDMWQCGCNRIESLLLQRPEAHPWPTGELPGDVVRNMAIAQGYGQAAPPSRGMTPPYGTRHGDLTRQYHHEVVRRNTDPNLRREQGGGQ